jgi:hypothetical protein
VHDEMKRRCVATQPCNKEGLTPLDTAVGNTADYSGGKRIIKKIACACVRYSVKSSFSVDDAIERSPCMGQNDPTWEENEFS